MAFAQLFEGGFALVACCWLCGVCCTLFFLARGLCWSLVVVSRPLFVCDCLLFVVHIVWCLLSVVCCALVVARCLLFVSCCLLLK